MCISLLFSCSFRVIPFNTDLILRKYQLTTFDSKKNKQTVSLTFLATHKTSASFYQSKCSLDKPNLP